jgi:hypothetical protein
MNAIAPSAMFCPTDLMATGLSREPGRTRFEASLETGTVIIPL